MDNDSKKLKRSESFYDQENRKMEEVLTQDIAGSVADKRKISLSESSILATSESTSGIESTTNKKPRKFKPKKFIAKHFKTSSKKELKTDDGINLSDPDLRSSSPAGSSTGTAATVVEKLRSPKIQVNKIKGNLMKTFSIKKKQKVGPEFKSVDIEDTESNIKRLAGLSVSQTSLCEIEDSSLTSEKGHEDVLHQEATEKPQTEGETDNKQKQSELTKKSQLKITISGKVSNKVSSVSPSQTQSIPLQSAKQTKLTNEPTMNETTATSSNKATEEKTEMENIKPISGENVGDGRERPTEKKEEENKRKSIDEKILEAIRESENNLQKLLSTSAIHKTTSTSLTKTQETKKLNVTKASGASESVKEKTSEKIFEKTKSVEKETLKEPKVKESSGFMKKFEKKAKKENSKNKNSNENKNVTKEATTVRVQEARKPYHVNFKSVSTDELMEKENGNNVKTEPPISESPTVEISSDDIKFNIGTSVRPLRTSSSNAQPPIRDILSIESSENLSREGSIDANSQHSPKSEKSDKSGGSSYRRKIAYVPQLTVYTPEEQELLKVSMGDSFDLKSPPIEDDSLFPFPNCEEPMDIMTTTSPEKREHLYKILVIGELGTGKTSFIKRYVHQFFSQNYRATIGVDFALKVLNWDQNTTVRLQLWDIAGQERFGNMTRVYYKEAVGAFIVFDVTRSATFDAVIKWKQDLDSKVQLPDGSPIPCILLANKCDQQKQGIVTTPAKLDEYCRENNFAGWFETSAKDNINIEDAAKALVNKILINDKLINSGEIFDNEKFALNGKDDRNGSKKYCSC